MASHVDVLKVTQILTVQVQQHYNSTSCISSNMTMSQISMSVMKDLTVVEVMQNVSILKVATFVPVYLDSLEMDRYAMVCMQSDIGLTSIYLLPQTLMSVEMIVTIVQ